MATEIERKFLVTSDEYRQLANPIHYKQGYISNDPEFIKRVRVAGEKAYVTVKSKNIGITRSEFEQETPIEEAIEMLEKIDDAKIIEKYRYKIEYAGKVWEVDEFLGANKGLVVAEIELNSESESFEKPHWIGVEVSEDSRYYNSNLCCHPFNEWK